MDTQNTPIHIKLWHRSFWYLAIAELCLTTGVFSFLISLPSILQNINFTDGQIRMSLFVFGVGLFLLAPFSSYLIQRFRRNKVFVVSAFILVAIVSSYLSKLSFCSFHSVLCRQLAVGALYGLCQIVLQGTLINDLCESFLRTEADHVMSWFSRFSLALGPCLAYLLLQNSLYSYCIIVPAALLLLSLLFVSTVSFPFKAPDDDIKLLSLDRFFLLKAWPLALMVALTTFIFGLVYSAVNYPIFYVFVLGGLILALLSEKYVFQNADLKSEAVSGFLALIAFFLIIMSIPFSKLLFLKGILFGFSCGIIGSRFLLFFIKLSMHCQRGTSQSSFILSWVFGLVSGLAFRHAVALSNSHAWLLACALTVSLLLIYNFCVHPWYIHNKNR